MDEFGYEKLKVWQAAMRLVDGIYIDTRSFPKEELFGLVLQMRKSAVSVPSNIAEGYGYGGKVLENHIRIAKGSMFELRTQMEIALRQGFVVEDDYKDRRTLAAEVSRTLDGLAKSLRSDR